MTDPRVTAHVLDVGRGVPAAGMRLTLSRVTTTGRQMLLETVTNSDGRTDAPLLEAGDMEPGIYEISYSVGDYFAAAATTTTAIATFFADVPVQFKIAETDVHVHVALLVSPWSYTTYRGS